MKKLIEIQSELKAPKNQRNNFGKYNYRSCEDILEAVKPLLLKHECTLTITDEIREVGGLVFVEAVAILSDDNATAKTIEGVRYVNTGGRAIVKAQAGINPDRKGMDIAQSFGSSSSYARKYALNGLFLIDDTKEIDSVDNTKKVVKKPLFTLDNFAKALEAKATIEMIKKSYSISAEIEKDYLVKLKAKQSYE